MIKHLSLIFLAITLVILPACVSNQTNEQRIINATENIENPIRTLEARAELETLKPMNRASDELLASIIPDALIELDAGSPAFQRALIEPDQIYLASNTSAIKPDESQKDQIESNRRTQAIKLYTQARTMRQSGQSTEAVELLRQAARLDPSSAPVQRELGDALIISNDRIGAIAAFSRAIELGDRSPRALVHLASEDSLQADQERIIWLAYQALNAKSINNHPMARSIAGVLLGNAEINSGYLKAGAQTLGDALESFDTKSRDLRWRREIIQILSQRTQLWILVGDAWASIGAHQRAQDAYSKAGVGVDQSPLALIARQIASALRQGRPASASLIFLDHLQNNVTDLSNDEIEWARSLSSIKGIDDVLGSAIGELAKRPGLTTSIRRSLLSVELGALDTNHSLARLVSAQLDANDPIVCMQVLSRIEDETDRYKAAVTILDSNPSISRAIASGMIRTLEDPVAFMHKHAKPKSESAELLMVSIGLALGRADLIEHLSIEKFEDQSADWLAAHTQALALTGRLNPEPSSESILSWLQRPSYLNDPHAVRLMASTMLISQQPEAAWELIQSQADDADAKVEDLVLGAQIAQTLKRYESALAFLERASELDPYNEYIYEQLFVLRSSASPLGEQEELRFIVRQLSTARPRSVFIHLIRANELARNGFILEAETLLIELNADHPRQEIGYELLMSIWKTQSTEDQSQALVAGIEWIEARLQSDPNSIQGTLAVAQGLFELEAYQRAFDLLSDGYARTGSFEIARAIEELLAGPLEQPDAADEHIVNRLEGLRGVDPGIEYIGYLATQATPTATDILLTRLIRTLPNGIILLPAQQTQLTQVVFSMVSSIEKLNHEETILSVIEIIESHSEQLSFELARIKVLLLAQLPELDFDQLIEAVNLAASQTVNVEDRSVLQSLPIQSLLSENRSHEAIVLAARFATQHDTLDEQYTIDTFQIIAAQGGNADMIGVLELLEAHGMMEQAVEMLTTRLGTPGRDKPANTPDQQRADLAYIAAVLTTSFERNNQAGAYYELALSYDPDHAWSNNDYGYMLAESGERMDFAVELLERAAKALPDEASVIDSLAWIRYKMGIFDDVLGDEGQPNVRGAISLLIRANELDIQRENATIMRHLGDALWRGGYTDRASDAWLGAEDILRGRLRLIRVQTNPNRRVLDALNADLREIKYRLQDAESTGKPNIAPLADGVQSD